MKAAVLKNWFDLELTDIPMPVPNEKEALLSYAKNMIDNID